MIVFAGRTSSRPADALRAESPLGEDDYVQVVKEAPACKYVMPELAMTSRCTASSTAALFRPWVRFLRSRKFAASPWSGRFYNEETSEARNVAFLGSDAKKQLFAEREAIGQTISMNGILIPLSA